MCHLIGERWATKTGVLCLLVALLGLQRGEKARDSEEVISIAFFVPGILSGSAIYEDLASAFEEESGKKRRIAVQIIEGGLQQSEWEEQLTFLSETRRYDIIFTTNPSLPAICARVGKRFPAQRFVVFDAYLEGNPQIATLFYRQYEQAFLLGHLAGLLLEERGGDPKIGIVAAQHFPLLDKRIIPGLREGVRTVLPGVEMTLNIVGNWFDISKAARLAESMIARGVEVITSIAGSSDHAVYRMASKKGVLALVFNTNQYAQFPGTIVGCGKVDQKRIMREVIEDVLAGTVAYGKVKTMGVKSGYIHFLDEDPGYRDHVSPEVQRKFAHFLEKLRRDGLAVPTASL